MSKVKVYSTPTCAYCVTLKQFLEENKIEFEAIDVSSDQEAQNYIMKKTGKMAVPVIEIDDEIIVGFDREKIVKLLNIS